MLPNRNPFTEATIAFNDPTLTTLSLSYLDENGAWQDTWDVESQKRLPRAIRVNVGGTLNGRPQTLPLTVPLRERVIETLLAVRTPEPGLEHPLVQPLPGMPERMLQRLRLTRGEAVQRDGEVVDPGLRHRQLLAGSGSSKV